MCLINCPKLNHWLYELASVALCLSFHDREGWATGNIELDGDSLIRCQRCPNPLSQSGVVGC